MLQREHIESYAIGLYMGSIADAKDVQKKLIVLRVRDWLPLHPTSIAARAVAGGSQPSPGDTAAAPAPATDPKPTAAPAAPPQRAGKVESAGPKWDRPPLDAITAKYIQTAISRGRTIDSPRSGAGGAVFREVPPEGAVVIGVIPYFESPTEPKACGIQFVYQLASGQRLGAIFGQATETSGPSASKIGYAIGGLRFPDGAIFEDTDVMMFRIDRIRFDMTDGNGYRTRGRNPKAKWTIKAGLDGSLVVGLTGTLGPDGKLTGVGVVTLR